MNQNLPIVIIGAGISGLTAAIYLQRAGKKILLLEKENQAGGRIATDLFDSYLLDRGFQVLLTEYPETKALLDYKALQLKPFFPGALIFKGAHKMRFADVLRQPSEAFTTIFSAVGTIGDKFKLFRLSLRLKNTSIDDIFSSTEMSTIQYLKVLGFSTTIVENFFRPFLSGIFLEKELNTSCRMFEFVFKMFVSGDTSVPALGMQEIPRQLVQQINTEDIKYNMEVSHFSKGNVVLTNGETIAASAIISSIGGLSNPDLSKEFRSTTNVYFTAETSPVREGILVLNAANNSIVNHFCVMSDVSSDYSSNGRCLISVSLVGDYSHLSDAQLTDQIIAEISTGFKHALDWTFLKTIHVRFALPQQKNVRNDISFNQIKISDNVFVCGDYLLNGSINGAMKSGRLAAEAALQSI